MSNPRINQLDQSGASDGDVVTWDDTAGEWVPAAGGSSGSLTIQDENGTVATGVTQLDFQGAGVSAASGTGEVVVTISGGVGSGAYNVGRDTATANAAYTTITLGSTPVSGRELVFIDGRLLSSPDDYTLGGAVITLTVPIYALSRASVRWDTTDATPGGITLGGAAASPAIRTTNLAFVNNSSSGGVSFPVGTQVGDRAVVFAAHGFAATTPTGWTSLDNSTGANWNGAVFTKILDTTDLNAGAVTVSFGGTFQGELGLVVMAGPTSGIRETKVVRSATGASPVALTTSTSAATTDTALYFGSARATSSTTTVDRGTLRQQRAADTNAAAAVYTEDISSAGTVTANFSHSVTGAYYEVIVLLKGA